jgi:multiple sugar transport system permease protein
MQRRSVSFERQRRTLGIILVIPSVAAIMIFIFKPLLDSLLMSQRHIDLLFSVGESYVGLDNFAWLFGQSWFLPTLQRTVFVTLVTMSSQVILSFFVALLTDFEFPGRGVVRSLLISPWAIPVFVAALTWRWMYNPMMSPFAGLFPMLGLTDQPLAWLSRPNSALWGLIIALTWHGFPFVYLTIYAGLQQVPEELKDAARIDGANAAQVVRYITIPSIRYVLTTVIILRTIFLFNQFPFIFLLTGGGPLNATETLAISAIKQGVSAFNYGRASAITTTMFFVLVVLFLLYFVVNKKREEGGRP